jgi:hypothetical protein
MNMAPPAGRLPHFRRNHEAKYILFAPLVRWVETGKNSNCGPFYGIIANNDRCGSHIYLFVSVPLL